MGKTRRDACDSCHFRKIRCWSSNPGKCINCQTHGRPCVFGKRKAMGRPRKIKKPDAPRPLTPNSSRRQSVSSPKCDSRNEQTSQANPSKSSDKDISDGVVFNCSVGLSDQAPQCPVFDYLSDEMLPSPTQTETFGAVLTTQCDSPVACGHLGGDFSSTQRTLNQEPRQQFPVNSDVNQHTSTEEESRLTTVSSLIDQRVYEIYNQLTAILFELRQQAADCLIVPPQGSLVGLDRVFMSTVALCEAVRSFQRLPYQFHAAGGHEDPFCLTFSAASTAVTTVLDIYENHFSQIPSLRSRQRSVSSITDLPNLPENGGIGSIQSDGGLGPVWDHDSTHTTDGEGVFDAVYLPSSPASQQAYRSSISHRLSQCVHLTVMDFHLGQLQSIFHSSQLPFISESFDVTWEKNEANRLRLQGLRASLQAEIEALKTGP